MPLVQVRESAVAELLHRRGEVIIHECSAFAIVEEGLLFDATSELLVDRRTELSIASCIVELDNFEQTVKHFIIYIKFGSGKDNSKQHIIKQLSII